jgi:hypothetical protein
VENTRAHQKHQDLIIGNACALIHGVQAVVQKAYDFSPIEVRDRGKNRAAEGVLQEGKESLLDGRQPLSWDHFRVARHSPNGNPHDARKIKNGLAAMRHSRYQPDWLLDFAKTAAILPACGG